MSLVADSPLNSSSSGSDDFAAFLDGELDSGSDVSPELEDDEDVNIDDSDVQRIKKRKVELVESVSDSYGLTSIVVSERTSEKSVKDDTCPHPGEIAGMCIRCGQKIESQSGVPFGYIHKFAGSGRTRARVEFSKRRRAELKHSKDLRLANDEVNRLRDRDVKSLLQRKKLYLVLDLDHTLLNSTRFMDITKEEEYLRSQTDPLQGVLKGSIFKLDFMHMFTKLRPFVHTFLKEASNLFEMYIYTMGERAYALEMAKLLDPGKVYFESRVIAQGDCTQRHQKGLDVVLGQESAVLILDDTESVWAKHKENLILMERYHFFASSCKQFGFQNCKSLSELKSDESDVDGALAAVLEVLKRVHTLFFDPELREDLPDRDVRQTLKAVRREVLKDCKVVFTHVFPTHIKAENHPIWKMAEQLGASCSREVDPTVTHVISADVGTDKSRWAVKENKFLVNTRWIEAANYFWRRQPEENFPVIEKAVKKDK